MLIRFLFTEKSESFSFCMIFHLLFFQYLFNFQAVHDAIVSKSTEMGMIKQLNVKLQETMLWKKTNFSIVNDDLRKLESKWDKVSELLDQR